MKKIAIPAIAISAMLLFSSCGDNEVGKVITSDSDLSKYPISTETELTYWGELPPNVSSIANNFGETEFAKELAKRTGVKVTYIHPSLGQESAAFGLMIASNDYPDIIEWDWLNALGGPASSINDKLIISLNDYMEDYAPALTSYLKDNPDIDKRVKTDNGDYYCFPYVRGNDRLLVSYGPVIRQDWLDDLNLQIPDSLESWENVLRQFRDKKGATAPITVQKGGIASIIQMMNAPTDFYVDDNGKIQFGPLSPEYKAAIEVLKRWYAEGLLDKNFMSVDGAIQDSNILTGKSGATFASGGSGLGKWMAAKKDVDPKFNLSGAPFCCSEPGKTSRYSVSPTPYAGYGSAAVTTACKDPALAVKFLDYSYTEDGHLLNNFGIEDVSYTVEDGKHKYTDLITNNSEGLSMNQSMSVYLRACNSGPFVQDVEYIDQYYALPQQQQALEAWTKDLDEAKKYAVPPTTFSLDESDEFASIYAELKKHRDTSITAFIVGTEPMEKYDDFIDDFKALGVDRAIELKQNSLDRYNKR